GGRTHLRRAGEAAPRSTTGAHIDGQADAARLHPEGQRQAAAARDPGVAFILHLDASGLRMVQRGARPSLSAYTLVRRRTADPAAPGRFAERGDDGGRQADPPGAM